MTPDSMGNLPQKNKNKKTTTTFDNSAVVRRFGHSVIASHCFFSKKFGVLEGHFFGAFLTTKKTFCVRNEICGTYTLPVSGRFQPRFCARGKQHYGVACTYFFLQC